MFYYRWVSYEKENRIKYFTPLLRCVRLGLLDPEYFMTKVKGIKSTLSKNNCTSANKLAG